MIFINFLSFFVSFFIIFLILHYKEIHVHYSGDNDFSGPQKVHKINTPRIGGLGIYLGLWISTIVALTNGQSYGLLSALILLASFPVIIAGFAEDLTKLVGKRVRLITGFISGILLINFFSISTIQIDIFWIDKLLQNHLITLIFLSIACAGLSNSYNIIDGFNGLASMVGIITALAISFVAYEVGDTPIASFSLMFVCSIFGFFIWNYPKGKIFLGDGGAYLIGFIISALSILLVHRNTIVSPWFALLINAYPIIETLFSIWRRLVINKKNPGLPDRSHLHSLIYRKLKLLSEMSIERKNIFTKKNIDKDFINSHTSPYLWAMTSICSMQAIIFWNNTIVLSSSFLVILFLYIYIYKSILRRNVPWWLIKK